MTFRTTRTAVALLCATAVAVLPAAPAHADQVRNNQWHLRYLNVVKAHKISQGAGITVAVIDSGVDPHPDLRNNLLRGTATYPGESGDGRQDGDPNGHGTAMAGLIAAHGRGNDGALGIAPKAKILPIRDVRAKEGTSNATAAAIEWAVSKRVDIISLSASVGSTPRLTAAVDTALKADIVIVAAAGNRPGDILIQFPAATNGVVAVGATDRSGNHADVSVTGRRLVISAPGVGVYTTSIDGRYQSGTGTSSSTAIVAGAAALVRSKFPDLSAEEVVHRLTATAVDKGAPGRDEEYGYGVLDLVAALTADVPTRGNEPTATAQPTPNPTQPGSNAVSNPDNKSGAGSTVLIGVLIALAVLGLLVTLLVMLLRRREQGRRF